MSDSRGAPDDDAVGDADRSDRDDDDRRDAAHLEDVPDGAGCAEIWERLSERREV